MARLIGELDSLRISDHQLADPHTETAHSCGHNASIAGIFDAAMGLSACVARRLRQGPRSLATIGFGVIAFDEKLPGNDTIVVIAGGTVLLSVTTHGISANPLVKAIVLRSAEASAAAKSA